MTALKTDNEINADIQNSLFNNYSLFYEDFYLNTQKAIKKFFEKDYELRFIGISENSSILSYGDEYFVSNIPVGNDFNLNIKISSEVVDEFLNSALGKDDKEFELKNLTEIEARLIQSLTSFIYSNIEDKINKTVVNKAKIQNNNELYLTFFIRYKKNHIGKIIIKIPSCIINEPKTSEIKEKFNITDFKDTTTTIKIEAGKSKIALNEIKSMEAGDIILLEDSDINYMTAAWSSKTVKFKVNPNPSIIINLDKNGGNDMEEETTVKSQNMWDSILVDITAEFDNVKMTLGELKQISEGLVIDVGSVYDNKIKLRVENQLVATGELVILNDRYGVRIDNVKKTKEAPVKKTEKAVKTEAQQPEQKTAQAKPAGKTAAPKAAAPTQKPQAHANEDENFDYSDFEIEDESI